MKEKIREFVTFQILDGIELIDEFVELKTFELIKNSAMRNYLIPRINENQNYIYDVINNFDESKIILKIKVKASEYNEASEKARKLSELFEYLMYYVIANLNFIHSIGTKGIRNTHVSRIITSDSSGIGFGSTAHSIHKNYVLDKETVLNPEFGYDYLWELIAKENLNNLQKRIVVSIEWIGKAMWERDKTKSFIQIMIAFESLLKYDEKGIISPSIANQISEWGAYIHSDKYDERIKIFQKIKDIYYIRSKIVHSGSSDVTHDNLFNALSILKNIIIKLSTEYRFIESMESLNKIINEKKFQ